MREQRQFSGRGCSFTHVHKSNAPTLLILTSHVFTARVAFVTKQGGAMALCQS